MHNSPESYSLSKESVNNRQMCCKFPLWTSNDLIITFLDMH